MNEPEVVDYLLLQSQPVSSLRLFTYLIAQEGGGMSQ